MGNLVNAKSFRLGVSVNWSDIWFSEWAYFPDIIEKLLKVRYYLIFFFSKKIFERKSYFYSHFTIVKFYKSFYIRFYTYYGIGEDLRIDMNDWYRHLVHKYVLSQRRVIGKLRWLPHIEYHCGWLCVLMYVMVMESLNLKFTKFKRRVTKYELKKFGYKNYSLNTKEIMLLKKQELDYSRNVKDFLFKLKHAFRLGNLEYLQEFFLWKYGSNKDLNKFFPNKRLFTFKTLLFYIFLIHWEKSGYNDRGNYEDKLNFNKNLGANEYFDSLLEELIWVYILMYNLSGLFNNIGGYLQKVIFILTEFKMNIDIYIITNEEVTGKFLARFFVRKLQKKARLWSLINPIRSELCYVSNSMESSALNWYKNMSGVTMLDSIERKNFIKDIWLNLLQFLVICDNKFLYNFFYKTSSLFTLYMFNLYLWINENFVNKTLKIRMSIKYIKQRSMWKLLYGHKNEFLSKNLYKLFMFYNISTKTTINLLPKLKIKWAYDLIFFDYYLGNNVDNYYSNNNQNRLNLEFLGVMIQLNRVLNYTYIKYNYNSHVNITGSCRLRERMKNVIGKSVIIGFKFRFAGRFTRRQRAKKLWVSAGKVPLNTVSANIDYGWHDLPLVNSAASVKVWLYRNDPEFEAPVGILVTDKKLSCK